MTTIDTSYLEAWRARARAAADAARAWRLEREAEAAIAARALAAFPGVRRVVLFGGVARGEAGPGSDVDLWVEGLAEADWLDAVAAVRAIVTRADPDLVRAEWAGDALASRVGAEGRVLYEA